MSEIVASVEEALPSNSVLIPADDSDKKSRDTWTGQCDFIFSCIGYAIGLGNIWRFPYLCYKNGGASFLIPYMICLILCGMPLVIFEVHLGQFASLGSISVWQVSPLFKGIGWSMLILSYITGIYYNVIIAWTLHYMGSSFHSRLPWADCDHEWADLKCFIENKTVEVLKNVRQFPAEQYWERQVLGVTDYSGNRRKMLQVGHIQWQLALTLLFAWILVFGALVKGIRVSGKVVYFTATFPYVILIALCIRGLTLNGSASGISYYIIPVWERLADPTVWSDAASQIFYSQGIGFGCLATMASYNNFDHNCYRDAIILPLINCFTSLFTGFAVFSIIGFMSYETGLSIKEVVQSGPGLIFIVFPAGLSKMPVSSMWSVLFFFMVILLGLDSQFAMIETIISGIADEFPLSSNTTTRKTLLVLAITMSSFIIGLPLVTQAGVYYFTIFDNYSATYSLFIIGVSELIAICYFYGYNNFRDDIKMMRGQTLSLYWLVCWMVICPIIVSVILLAKIIKWAPSYYGDYTFPAWADGVGFVLAAMSAFAPPVYASFLWIKTGNFRANLRPTDDWGPAELKNWYKDERYIQKLKALNKYDEMLDLEI